MNFKRASSFRIISAGSLAAALVVSGCTAAETKSASTSNAAPSGNAAIAVSKNAEPAGGALIEITPNGPADTVRVFYKHLREKRFREAIFLTNLRPAIEGLTEAELADFSLDLAKLAGQIPAEIEINGEIVAGDKATVTANLPGDEDKNELQKIILKRSGDIWIIQTVDDEAETRIKKEGKQHFYNLRIETHQDEAKKMLERVSKAQLAFSFQNGGAVTDIDRLIAEGLLPDDIKSSESTGYVYSINLTADKKSYYATATPATYGKSGRVSYLLTLDPKGLSRVTSKDNGGKVLAP